MIVLPGYITRQPLSTLQSAWERVPSDEYAQFGSLKGRAVCLLKMYSHTIATVLSPIFYISSSVGFIFVSMALNQISVLSGEEACRFSIGRLSIRLLLTGLVAPFGQMMQIFKAAMGLLHPGFYFKADELNFYFQRLAVIAEGLGCDPMLIDTFKNGPSIAAKTHLILFGAHPHYRALFERDLKIISERLSETTLSKDEKISILNMFEYLIENDSCESGFGRLLEQICGCLDAPKQPEKILPWLVEQYKEEVIHTMVMQARFSNESIPYLDEPQGTVGLMNDVSVCNILLSVLGESIGLSQKTVKEAYQDMDAEMFCLPNNQLREKLLERFDALFTEKRLEAYLMARINSQPDGQPGLKDLRNSIIQILAERADESEVKASKEEVQSRFKVGDALADDPSLYVKLHYYLYPDADPFDENASDINEKGIRAYSATLENDPFAYFAAKLT